MTGKKSLKPNQSTDASLSTGKGSASRGEPLFWQHSSIDFASELWWPLAWRCQPHQRRELNPPRSVPRKPPPWKSTEMTRKDLLNRWNACAVPLQFKNWWLSEKLLLKHWKGLVCSEIFNVCGKGWGVRGVFTVCLWRQFSLTYYCLIKYSRAWKKSFHWQVKHELCVTAHAMFIISICFAWAPKTCCCLGARGGSFSGTATFSVILHFTWLYS